MQATPVFLPGESQGRGSLLGCRLWGCTESDTTEATSQQQQPHTDVIYTEPRAIPSSGSSKSHFCRLVLYQDTSTDRAWSSIQQPMVRSLPSVTLRSRAPPLPRPAPRTRPLLRARAPCLQACGNSSSSTASRAPCAAEPDVPWADPSVG